MARKSVWTNADGLTVGFGNHDGTSTKGPTSGGAGWLTDGNEYDLMLPNGNVTLSADEITALKQLVVSGSSLATGVVLYNNRENFVRNSLNSALDNTIATPLKSIILPGGILGPRGYWELEFRMTHSGSSVQKNLGVFIGGVAAGLEWSVTTTGVNTHGRIQTYNSDFDAQDWSGSIVVNGTSGAPGFDGNAARSSAFDTSVDQQLDVHVRWAGAASSENITIRWLKLTAFYGA